MNEALGGCKLVSFFPPSLTVRLVRLSNVTRGKNIRPPISVQPGIKGAAFSVSKIGYGICGLAGEERDDGLAPVNEWEREGGETSTNPKTGLGKSERCRGEMEKQGREKGRINSGGSSRGEVLDDAPLVLKESV